MTAQASGKGNLVPLKPKNEFRAAKATKRPPILVDNPASKYESMKNDVLVHGLQQAIADLAAEESGKVTHSIGETPYEMIPHFVAEIDKRLAVSADTASRDPFLGPVIAALAPTNDRQDPGQVRWHLRDLKLPPRLTAPDNVNGTAPEAPPAGKQAKRTGP